MDDVVDFLILDTVYKKSIQTQWRAGSRFKSMIDNSYYSGTVRQNALHIYMYIAEKFKAYINLRIIFS